VVATLGWGDLYGIGPAFFNAYLKFGHVARPFYVQVAAHYQLSLSHRGGPGNLI
jgi:hypothetical protein